MVAGALDVGGAQRVGFGGAVLEFGGDGEGGFDGQRGEGVDEQLADLLVEAVRRGWPAQIRCPLAMPSRWHT